MQRLRSTICSSCCFGGGASEAEDERPGSLIRSSTVWIQSRAQELPDIGGRCRNLVARIGRHHHTRRGSGDFKYDPLSYALNFDEGLEHDDLPSGGDGRRYRSFSSRLPPSPPRRAAAVEVAS
ncbi:hypothetical protein Cni_G01297 [Canna indica]|uniref:Uncharacterized protein n=1 Tax=Canna indica TaxID=4628 RepID=A0AAQ3JPF7_9LILI|nr:hypothetical protein Cni_G01297 [Canna indica]